MKKLNKKEYLIGWSGQGQCLYGKEEDNKYEYVDPLTIVQAKRMAKRFP